MRAKQQHSIGSDSSSNPTDAGPASPRVVHFGQFLRWHRVNAGRTTDAFARLLGLTARRLIAIEAMAEPAVQHTTLAAVARQLGLSMEDLDRTWRSTPVPVTGRKGGPTTDAATRFNAACDAAGTTPAEGLRRLRLWLIDQPSAVQRAALAPRPNGGGGPAVARFTAVVDHLQDPAAATADRVAARARRPHPPSKPPSGRPAPSPARSPAPAAKAGSKRR